MILGTTFKRFLPRSLFGRAFLILIVPIIGIQLAVGFVFADRLFQDVTKQMTSGVAREIQYVVNGLENTTDTAVNEQVLRDLSRSFDFTYISLDQNAGCAETDKDARTDFTARHVIATLKDGISNVNSVDLLSKDGHVIVCSETSVGALTVSFDRLRASARNPHQLLVAMIILTVLLTGIALLFLRNQITPITRLAGAAESFGRGESVEFHPRGATEVRSAGKAFLSMRDRIERHLGQRTQMLSGVSHDLRTPLTRLRLSLSMMEETKETTFMLRDVQDMSNILDEFLDFSKGAGGEETDAISAKQLVKRLVKNRKRQDQTIDLIYSGDTAGSDVFNGRETALTRALDNLLGNAGKYGDRIKLTLTLDPNLVTFTVEDNGPGIPKEQRSQATIPFNRLDVARNQDKGSGVGLGLAITADVARAHGGVLDLGHSDMLGGLRASMSIPR